MRKNLGFQEDWLWCIIDDDMCSSRRARGALSALVCILQSSSALFPEDCGNSSEPVEISVQLMSNAEVPEDRKHLKDVLFEERFWDDVHGGWQPAVLQVCFPANLMCGELS